MMRLWVSLINQMMCSTSTRWCSSRIKQQFSHRPLKMDHVLNHSTSPASIRLMRDSSRQSEKIGRVDCKTRLLYSLRVQNKFAVRRTSRLITKQIRTRVTLSLSRWCQRPNHTRKPAEAHRQVTQVMKSTATTLVR